MDRERDWTVLFIGGASGTGKSSLAYEMARFYGVNVLEVDDIHLAVEAVTTRETFPATHYWDSGVSWMDLGIEGNESWLIDVSKELPPVLTALANRHMEDRLPIIIEGDFISPDLMHYFESPEVKSIFVIEADQQQLVRNYLSREGGALQSDRAEVSIAYGKWLAERCRQNGAIVLAAKPWDTLLMRAQNMLL